MQPSQFSGRDRWAIVLVVVVALTVRFAYLTDIEAYPKFEHIKNRLDDQVVFDAWAKATVAGEVFDYRTTGHEFAHWVAADPGVYPQAPLYPFFVATFYRLVGYQYDGLRALQMVLGALACGLLYPLARRFLKPFTSLLCALGLAFYGPQVFYEGTLLRAALFTALGILSLELLHRLQDVIDDDTAAAWRQRGLATLAGVALAAGVLMRPNVLLFAAVSLAWLAWNGSPSRRGSRMRILRWTALGLLLPLLPVIAVNTARSGHLAFLSSNGPYIFFIGNVHDAPGTSAGPSPYYFEVKAKGPATEVSLLREAVADIRRHPGHFIQLQGRKLLAFFGPRETPNNLSFAMALETNPRLRWAILRLPWILPWALMGLVVARRRRHGLLHLYLWSYTLSTVLFYVLARLRLPVVPVLLIFAGLAFEALWDSWHRGRRLMPVLLAMAALVGSGVLDHQTTRHRPVDYLMAAAAHASRGQMAERDGEPSLAWHHYSRALVLHPDHDEAAARLRQLSPPPQEPLAGEVTSLLDGARVRTSQQDLDGAEDLLRQAVQLAPHAAEPHHYLSNVYFLRGDFALAMDHLEAAVERAPLHRLYRSNLAALRHKISAEHHDI